MWTKDVAQMERLLGPRGAVGWPVLMACVEKARKGARGCRQNTPAGRDLEAI